MQTYDVIFDWAIQLVEYGRAQNFYQGNQSWRSPTDTTT